MHFDATFARLVLLAFASLTLASTEAMAQAGSVNFRIRFAGQVDCDRPIAIKNVPLTADVVGALNPDGTASGELTQTAFVLSSTVRFDGRLGAPPASAPGGTSQVRVTGRNGLRLIWNLPNNAIIVNISVRGQACTAALDFRLNPGKREYTLFDGTSHHYCGRPRLQSSSCEVR